MSKQNLQQFMLRKQRHRKMIQSNQIPKSTDEKFVVPCFQRSFGFRTNEYAKNTQKLQDYIDRVSFERFVRNANRIIDKQLLQKAKNESNTFFKWTSSYLKITILLGMLTFTVLSLIVYLDFSPEDEQKILNGSIVLIIFQIVVASLCPIYLFFKPYQEYDYQTIIKKELDKLAEEQNRKNGTENRQYLKWKFEQSFFWLQLHINKNMFAQKSKKLVHRFGNNDTPPLIQ